MNLTVKESSRGETPSKYVNKTFTLVEAGRIREGDVIGDRVYKGEGWDSYTAQLKNGKTLHFTRYINSKGPEWFVRQEGCTRGTWLYEVEIS